MRFWLSRETTIPIREQLGAQIVLGILSRRLPPGERLPSVRELARRLKIHPNTVSAVYHDLAERGWVRRRAGAGVFVADRIAAPRIPSAAVFAERCLEEGLAQGFSRSDLEKAFTAAFQGAEETRAWVVADPDVEMARILAAEIAEATGISMQAVKSENLPNAFPTGTCVLASEAHAVEMQERLPAGVPFRPIQLRSMQEVIAGQERPSRPVLICVVSGSKAILQWSATLLSALGFSPDGVIQRNSCEPGWELGLGACDIVAVDVVTARRAPASLPLTVFRIVSDDFLAALKDPVTDQEL